MSKATTALSALAFAALIPILARAQAAQTWSLLGSPFFTVQRFPNETVSGTGGEVQLRYSRAGTSVGLGAQYSTHTQQDARMKITGFFVEPRYALDVGSESLAPYLAGRFATLRQTCNFGSSSSGYAVGLGGGLMYKITRRVNLDLGGAVVRQSLGDITLHNGSQAPLESFFGYAVKAGLSIGLL